MNRASDRDQIKLQLKERIESLCRRLLPDGRAQGRLWVAHNPVTGDYAQTPEFKVALNRDIGAWIDYRTGDKGDVIRLIEYVNQCDFKAAMDWARDFLGVRAMDRSQREDLDRRARLAAETAQERERAERLKRMAQVEKLYHRGYQDGAGSVAEAYAGRYFAARGIALDHWPNRDTATFRFTEAQEFWARAQWRMENGRRVKLADGPSYPCIYSAGRLPTGQISGLHMTFLDPLGPRKLPIPDKGRESAKVMWGPWDGGAVIRLTHGPEGLPPELATKAHPLVIGEGIETTASVAIDAPEARAWAGGSLANMKNAPFWLPCISFVVLLQDHFKSKTTEKQFAAVVDAVERAGKRWDVMASLAGNDFNDMRQEGE